MNYTENLLQNIDIDYAKHKNNISTVFKKLKKKKPKNLDSFVHQQHEEVFEKIDCLACGNCCKSLGPRITDNDIAKMAKALKIKPSSVLEEYLRMDEDGDFVFKTMPCPFLMPDNYCMIYESRPTTCREYPQTDRKRFYQILDITKKNITTCPAVLEISKAMVKEFL